jgi:diguanylate cyclase (GGDEF)-like protein
MKIRILKTGKSSWDIKVIDKIVSSYQKITLVKKLAIPVVIALILEAIFAIIVIQELKQVDLYTNNLQNSLIPNFEKSTTNITLLKKISENITYAVLSSDVDMLYETKESADIIKDNLQDLNVINIKSTFQEYYSCTVSESKKMIDSGKISNDEATLQKMMRLYINVEKSFKNLDKNINHNISIMMRLIRDTTQTIIYLILIFIFIFSLIISAISYLIYNKINGNIEYLNSKLTQLQLKDSSISKSKSTNDILNDISKKIDITMFELNELEKEKQKAQKQAFQDQLTKLHNRHYLDKLFAKLITNDNDFALIILDIDHFKNVNDTYGHNIGDEVLIKFAKILQTSLREDDIVGRWGGEEFIIVVFSKDKNILLSIANKIKDNIENALFDSVGKITASLGISTHTKNSTIEDTIKKADIALYMAKESGRNKVTLYEENTDKIV